MNLEEELAYVCLQNLGLEIDNYDGWVNTFSILCNLKHKEGLKIVLLRKCTEFIFITK